ncbi:MAG: cytochrome b/b6 domain-containing protein [Desulfobacteraceae bacterium]|jgi:cytochrome b
MGENTVAKMESIKVWDIFVRGFHWALVGSMIGMYISGEEMKSVHIRLGYFVMVLVLVRIVWGFIGTKHARFVDFLYRPAEIFHYLKSLLFGKPIHYIGHNPAGGLMVLVMLITLLATTYAGLKALAADGKGPLANIDQSILSSAYADEDEHEEEEEHYPKSYRDKAKDEFWEEIHKVMTTSMLFFVVIHICGVLVSSWLHRENLILSMITGKKKSTA